MKKSLLVLIILVPTSITVGQQFEYGLKGGLNISTLKNESSDFDIYSAKAGYHVGLYSSFFFSEHLGLRTELVYSLEGANFENSDEFVRINRISVPLLFNYRFLEKVGVEVGPEFKLQTGFDSNVPASRGNVESLYEKLDYGISLGVEFLPFEKIGIIVRNYFGLKYHSETFISEEIEGQFMSLASMKSDRTNVFQLAIQYQLN